MISRLRAFTRECPCALQNKPNISHFLKPNQETETSSPISEMLTPMPVFNLHTFPALVCETTPALKLVPNKRKQDTSVLTMNTDLNITSFRGHYPCGDLGPPGIVKGFDYDSEVQMSTYRGSESPRKPNSGHVCEGISKKGELHSQMWATPPHGLGSDGILAYQHSSLPASQLRT